ncbi:MAG: hypothetical protein ACOYNI_04080 [Acidimicrobiia bacterium]
MTDSAETSLDEAAAGAIACLRATVGAVSADNAHPLNDTQYAVLDAVARVVFGLDVAVRTLQPLSAEETAQLIVDPAVRLRLVELMVTIELVLHPLPHAVAKSVDRYATVLGVNEPMVRAAREYASEHLVLMHADISRNSWYREEKLRETRLGKLGELVRSKLAMFGVRPDPQIEAKWAALADCPTGSWGRAVFDFYGENDFPLPGSRNGIEEVGARHDWVHVLAGYPPSPEGEIDVFSFIAATTDDPKAFPLVVTTFAMFQDYSLTRVHGKKIVIARADTLSDPLAPEHFAEAVYRGIRCNVDVMAIDHFEYANRDLEELRAEFNIPPLRDFTAD